MGRLTQAISYLNADPKKVNELKDQFTHLMITEELKELRKELKLYKGKDPKK